MVSVSQKSLTIIFSTEFVIGILGNGFIVLVNCIDWVKMRKISLLDQILTALVISRICLILSIMLSCLSQQYESFERLNRKYLLFIGTCWGVANHFSVWLATILSLFYFLKVANFSNLVFLYLKQKIEKVVLVMFLGILVFLPFNVTMTNRYIYDYEFTRENNVTWSDTRTSLRLTVFIFEYIIPFSASMTFFILLIFSLWKHLKNMKVSAARSRDFSAKAHITAMKTVISFLFLFAVYFLCFLPILFCFNISDDCMFFFHVLEIAYPSVHSFVLIMGNSKLRKVFLLIWWQLKCT
ncbi:PREDICTED: taste receptor type 2 member 14-like [Elephantulus edwardii]|uniref:taste receptor type 2 member 14-like n=1 Tax=Elephantulus edwardii TaxID=28737 RepID=UPI0003F0DEC3|nr:PREDICTED: taste receptor type 2 member 14-like [Elephantulus edwardii]